MTNWLILIQVSAGFISTNMNKISAYVKDSYRELMEKVTWPTWQQLQQSTMIVLVATIIITAIVWVMDLGIASLLDLFYSLF
jgi:preprotein translocase subunit SecE